MAKYEYRIEVISRHSDAMARAVNERAAQGWRLINVLMTSLSPIALFERELPTQIEIKDTPELREVIDKALPGSIKFDPFVRAQAEGEPLPGVGTPVTTVLGSYLSDNLEARLIDVLEFYENPDDHGVTGWHDQIEVDQSALRSLRQALQNDTWLMMTCASPTDDGRVPGENVSVEVEAANPDVIPATTVPKPADVVAPTEPASQWAAGWQIIGKHGNEFYVKGNYSHCCQELTEALDHVTGPNCAAAQQVLYDLKRRPEMRGVAHDGNVLAWIKPL